MKIGFIGTTCVSSSVALYLLFVGCEGQGELIDSENVFKNDAEALSSVNAESVEPSMAEADGIESEKNMPAASDDSAPRSDSETLWFRIYGSTPYLYLESTDTSTTDWRLYNNDDSSGSFQIKNNNGLTWMTGLTITEDRDVGIGTAEPDNKLDVHGTIRSEEIIVELFSPADYVFDDNYDLWTLEEIEEYITKEKHLPGMPSAQDIDSHGVSLGDSHARLLQKVEELTLYMIKQNKEIKNLKKQLSSCME